MNKKHQNEIAKLKYYQFLKEAEGKAEATIRRKEKSIHRYEAFTRFEDFRHFGFETAVRFKMEITSVDLHPATMVAILQDLIIFFRWLSQQPGYRKELNASDAEFFRMSNRAVKAAKAPTEKSFPSLVLVRRLINSMPCSLSIEERDRVLIGFIAITGIRDGAAVSLKIGNFDRERMLIRQNPLSVNTKNAKSIDTFIFPIAPEFESQFIKWVDYLETELGFGADDPLFPATLIQRDSDNCFINSGLSRKHWETAGPVRKIFRDAFSRIGVDPHGPHSFRRMIVSEMYRRNLSIEEFKAWSQNLGHEGAMTTLTSYGKIGLEEQGRLVRTPGQVFEGDQKPLTAAELEKILNERGL